jgi:DNA-binding beta-propeller fold protein YncE
VSRRLHAALLVACTWLPATTYAQIAVSSNDGKAVYVDGVNTVPANPRPDTVTVLDLSVTPPRVVGEVDAPGGWSAPPQSVAVAPDESIALVASGAKIDPADPRKTVFNDVLSVIDLTGGPPKVIATLQTGRRAAGVSINPAGTLALVANRAEGTVSVFTIAGKTVTPAGKVDLRAPDAEPSLPVFTPDGRTALVTLNNGHRVAVLSIDGEKVEYTGRDIAAGLRPYGIEVAPSGDVAVVADIGNGPTGGVDTIQVIDLRMSPPRVVGGVFAGIIPEGIAISPDGRFVATALQNGANLSTSSPLYHKNGILKIYALSGTTLTYVTEAPVGRWCQGVAWSRAMTTVLVQCAADNVIEVLAFDGRTLRASTPISVTGAPTGIRTADRPAAAGARRGIN